MDNAHHTIAVVGATGQQGGAATRALLADGFTVRAITRRVDSDAARELVDAGAEVVAADLDDPASVRAAFDGADGVFAMTTMSETGGAESPTDAETRHGTVIADAAKATGVQHLVYSSVGAAERGTGIPHFESKYRVEQYIASIGQPATIVRPVFFIENLRAEAQDGLVVLALPLPDGIPMQTVAAADIGRVASAVMLDPAWLGRSIEIAGDTRTGSEMAAAFGQAAGLPAEYQALPISVLDGNEDMLAMFSWFTEPYTYAADFAATRALDPGVQDLDAWIAASGWAV
ncbi:NmrA/HSCARG family protein [Herbiconiux sp. CPCC 205763]|uniref:NmrA/HSCARG family protein n=1 Tax=Herbiconiux aconitum TaxID=2970913 RepID=A0ABT2GN63_9MICO|nr:NmrA/HSCARG family protein [Herbiconiux aconitum]MCS5717659.1 NmrA/HSCARG family protein [Herbiconiux aconitum]